MKGLCLRDGRCRVYLVEDSVAACEVSYLPHVPQHVAVG